MVSGKPSFLPSVVASLGLAALLAALPVGAARAHPHAWIDVTVQVLFDAAGNAAGLRERWLFDEYYSAYAVSALAKNSDAATVQAKLDDILRQNMENLKEYAYFTRVDYRGKEVEFAPVTEMATTLKDARLDMTFVVPFKAPLDLGAQAMTYSIYDPAYYIEMLHAESPDAIGLEAAPAGCTFRLVKPTPSFEAVGLAAALDRNQTAADGLGALFAEKVDVRCP